MKNSLNKTTLILIVLLLIFGCKQNNSLENPLVLHYDYYSHDTLFMANALTIEYIKKDDSIRDVNISGKIDSLFITFKEKIDNDGIYRSVDELPYRLTHSFIYDTGIQSNLSKSYPYFLNALSKKIRAKKYSVGNADSVQVYFFDEAIPWYSYTDSYFRKDLKLFLLFYNPRKNSYFKLSKIDGKENNWNNVLTVEDEILKDTTFFAKFYKSPEVLPPDINK